MEPGVRAVVIGIAATITVVALFMAVAALFVGRVERGRRAADDSPGRSFAVGAVNVLFLGALGLGFSALVDATGQDVFQLPALLFLSLLAILVTFGLTCVAVLLGSRLFPTASPFRRRLGGGIVLTLAALTPFVGWFGLLPYAAFLGSGAMILGLLRGAAPGVAGGAAASDSSDADEASAGPA